MKVGSAEWRRYRVALFLAEPFRIAINYLENYGGDGWGEHGYEWNTRRLIAARLATFLEPLHALPFVWIARNSDDEKWSFIDALKVTICLLLHIKPHFNGERRDYFYAREVSWFGARHTFREPGDGGAKRWKSIKVGEPGHWFAYIEEDWADYEW